MRQREVDIHVELGSFERCSFRIERRSTTERCCDGHPSEDEVEHVVPLDDMGSPAELFSAMAIVRTYRSMW